MSRSCAAPSRRGTEESCHAGTAPWMTGQPRSRCPPAVHHSLGFIGHDGWEKFWSVILARLIDKGKLSACGQQADPVRHNVAATQPGHALCVKSGIAR